MHQLFIDQNIRIEVAEALREDGYQIIHASDANLARRDDEEILRFTSARKLRIASNAGIRDAKKKDARWRNHRP
jgi:predicted nuclease of predicted toxin-antitoxin system